MVSRAVKREANAFDQVYDARVSPWDHGPTPSDMPAISGQQLRTEVERLAGLGPRFCGTEGEHRCRSLLLKDFARAGLTDVDTQEFEYLAYVPGRGGCHVAAGGGMELTAVGLQSTAVGSVRAEAVYVGDGGDAALAAVAAADVDIAGRIAVVHAAVPSRVVPRLVSMGAAAIVHVADTPDGLIGSFTATFYPPPMSPPWTGRVLPVPGVTIEATSGQRLLALMSARQVVVEVEHRARYEARSTANVIGKIPGHAAREEDRPVVIGAHYDTQLESPGAADNAAGVAVLVAVGRLWSKLQLPRTVVLAAMAAEELASWGACHYVASARRPALAMVNLDALGPPVLARRTIVAHPAIARFAAESAARVGWAAEVELDAREFPFADHAPFIDAGIPACWIWRYPPPHPYYHSAGDTPRWVDWRTLDEDAQASAYVAFRLAHLQGPDAEFLLR
jgi:hypothetical protein